MKFKFCSDGDCPLWALAGLHALSTLSTSTFKALLNHIVEEQPDDGIMDILKDTSLSSREECARAAAVIRWVLNQALRCSCSSVQLTRDLLVLAVPRAHATALAEAMHNMKEKYEQNVRSNGFMINKLTDVSVTDGPEGTIDTFKLALHTEDVFTCTQKIEEVLLDKEQAKFLLEQLKQARNQMEKADAED